MAENNKIRHVLHRRSNVSSPKTINIERTTLQVNEPKAPKANNIEYGEIAVNYGAAHGALAMTTPGDTTMASKKEVEAIMGGAGARVQR